MGWHVLGRGAVGCLWAANLRRAGQEVTVLVRPDGVLPPTTGITVSPVYSGGARSHLRL